MVASCQSWLIVMNRPNNSRFPFCHGYPKSSMSWPDDHDFFSYWNKAVWLGDHPWLKHSFWGSLRADNNKNWPVAWFLFFKHTKGIFHGMTGWDDELFFFWVGLKPPEQNSGSIEVWEARKFMDQWDFLLATMTLPSGYRNSWFTS